MGEYENIASGYAAFNSLLYRTVEEKMLSDVLRPLLKPGSKVLDLACGAGYYSSRVLTWGAGSVTGVDLSPAMLTLASSDLSSQISMGQAHFITADCQKTQSYAPDSSFGYFDLVVGAWLLNYASNRTELTDMFANIAHNLKVGGVFVGIVPYPCDDIGQRATAYARPSLDKIFPRNKYIRELDHRDGWELHVYINDQGVDFTTWHLKRDVIEECAVQGGMLGHVEWIREELVGGSWEKTLEQMTEDVEERMASVHCGILIIHKTERK